jgi:hypothetical protein
MVATMNGLSSLGSSALQYAQQGISRGMANLDADSQAVAQGVMSSGGDSGAVTGALVDAQQQALNVEASAKALAITNQTLGTLLDVHA